MNAAPRYTERLAAPHVTDPQAIEAGLVAGLRLHKFRAHSELPRVAKVLGFLRGRQPESLDIGSGGGIVL